MADKSSDAMLQRQGSLEVPERAVNMIFLTIFCDILATTISTPVMPFYAKMFGASTVQIGYLFAAWSFCSTVFAPILGRLSDKYGRRPILIAALFGAGFANVCQGLSAFAIDIAGKTLAFYVFGFFRGFSGVFAAIGTVTNVYMADVVPKAQLAEYMAKMSIVGPLAFTFGPGLGGGLAKIGGNNVPVLVDGIICMFAAFIVSQNLPETPAFLKLKAEREAGADAESGVKRSSESASMPWQVWTLAIAAFFGGLTMSAGVSMQAVFLNEVYGLDVLHVTYVSVGSAVALVLTGMFVSTRVKNCFGIRLTVVMMNVFGGFLYLFMAQCGERQLDVWFFVVSVWLTMVQSSVAGACTAPLLNEFTETSNRGKVNSTNQLCMNLGRMLGPLTYGHVAEVNINYVWAIAGIALFAKAFLTMFVQPKEAEDVKIRKRNTEYGELWEDEAGTLEDEKELGKFVAGLLTKGHYKWVSRRSDVESLLEKLLPELSIHSKEEYDKHIAEMELRAAQFMSTAQN